ncbi:MAG TPA: HD domain-containing protein [Polyangiales bacterium]|jgi:predicted HD phosphohydrolase|nr:HD domain-containing protein [Polyangiales bacterium]
MSEAHSGARAKFHRMVDGTRDDWQIIAENAVPFTRALPERVLAHLQLLKGDFGGYAVDRFEHSLQTASRAHRDGRDEEYVVCALLHDIGDTLGCLNHADIGAAILKPFVSEQNLWMVEKHAIFQGYYFFEFLGLDKNMRDRFQGHEHYAYTAEFCEKYDQNSFEPGYDTLPLEAFEPMLRRVMARPKRSIYMR